jgi:hypothetical protein
VPKIPESGRSEMAALDLTADFNAVLGRGARKQLARDTRVSDQTTKRWFAGYWPACRQRELGELLLAHIERQEARLSEIKDRARLLAGRSGRGW